MPLLVTFGSESFKAGVDLSTAQFWERMVAPGRAVPDDRRLVAGRVQGGLRGGLRRGRRGDRLGPRGGHAVGHDQERPDRRDMLPDREIHVVDSRGASMAEGILAPAGRRARRRRPRRPPRSPRPSRRAAPDMRIYVALETLEYLKKGGRISGAQAAIGTLLSVKPIIRVKDGVVETVDRVRTRVQGARAADRAHLRASDRAARDPPHDQPRRRGVPRRGRSAAGPGLDPGGRDDRPRGRLGRAAPRARAASARRSCIAPEQRPAGRLARCGKVATTLPTGTIGEARIADLGLYSATQMSRAQAIRIGPSGPGGAPRGVVRETTQPTAVR